MKVAERWSEHTRQLPPLVVGDHVRVQNQIGPHPKKWDKTGVIIEVLQFDQYRVRINGSGRTTLRNRKFLRKYLPVHKSSPRHSVEIDLPFLHKTPPPCGMPTPHTHTSDITTKHQSSIGRCTACPIHPTTYANPYHNPESTHTANRTKSFTRPHTPKSQSQETTTCTQKTHGL